MRLDTRALATAAALTTAAVYTVCSLFVALAPGSATAFFSYALHLDLTSLSRPLTWGSYFTGLLCLSILVALVGGTLGALYNRFAAAVVRSERTLAHAAPTRG